jgi:hypothetical protein
MDERSVVIAGVAAAIIAALLIVAYLIRWMGECLAQYFSGDLPLDRLAQLTQETASRRFMGSPECQALVQSAFHRAAEAKLFGNAPSLKTEKQLLAALADVKSEFGLPERYRNDSWRAGRE